MSTIAAPALRITSTDLLGVRDNNSMELVDGRIVEKNVSVESSQTEMTVAFRLLQHAMKAGIAHVYPQSLGYRVFQHLIDDPDRIRKPDATVILSKRVAMLNDPNPGYMPIVPDLAVEVFSPNDLAHEMAMKVQEYKAAGFPLVWVVDPDLRTVTVFPNPGKPYILSEDDQISAEQALPGFACKVADLFPSSLKPQLPPT